MAITRAKPAGFSTGEKMTSAVANQMDINPTYALDKRSGQTDTLSSGVTCASGSSITHASGSTETYQSGSTLTLNSGATCNISNVVTITGSGAKITTASSGRIELGNNDWVQLAAGHSGRDRVIVVPATSIAYLDTSFMAVHSSNYVLANSGAGGNFIMNIRPHNGATLQSAILYFKIGNGSHAGIPSTTPGFDVRRHSALTPTSPASLRAAGPAFYTTGSLSTYNNSAVKQLSYICDQNNVIDVDTYYYTIRVTDEAGTNSQQANEFYAVALLFSTITDTRPF